ncbi:hypothetical protein ACOSQ3_004487 [Xanthoceras sorbifolium]
MKREFINLKQRQMTVTEYEKEFIRLSKYAREMVATEANRCRRFEDGLNDYIRLQITALQLEDFTLLVSAALNIKRVKKDEQARRDRSQQRKGPRQSSSSQPPKHYGKRHAGEWTRPTQTMAEESSHRGVPKSIGKQDTRTSSFTTGERS